MMQRQAGAYLHNIHLHGPSAKLPQRAAVAEYIVGLSVV